MKTVIAYTLSSPEENVFQVMWENLPTTMVILFSIIVTVVAMVKVMKGFSRFEKVESAVKTLGTEMDRRFDRMDEKFAALDKKFDTIITILLSKKDESSPSPIGKSH